MLDKNTIKHAIKYLLMFMIIILSTHIVTKGLASNEQCIIIATIGATTFIALDYYAPSCNINVSTSILTHTNCDEK